MIGLHEPAWAAWLAYRKLRRKPYKTEHGLNRAMKRLASFGEWQMESVQKCIDHEWIDLYCITDKEIAQIRKERAQANKDAALLANLRERAQKIGYRDCVPNEDLAGYKFLVERAEREDADRRWRESRNGPKNISELLERRT